MSDIKLFALAEGLASELKGFASDLEKPLQNLIEKNLEVLLGIRFLATEYSTGKTHAGRIDTLGLDENDCPVILEYKRSSAENVINQGLFYLDWLMDHQAEFRILVLERYGLEASKAIDWYSPRLVCVAADFTKYDGHAVQQMNRNIELIRYRQFGQGLLLLELVNAVTTKSTVPQKSAVSKGVHSAKSGPDKTVAEWFTDMSPAMRDLFESLEGYVSSLGDDVMRKDLKLYIAFKRIKNFATVVFQRDRMLVYLRINPETVELVSGFSRDVRSIGHWGTGELELSIKNQIDLEKSKVLLQRTYEGG